MRDNAVCYAENHRKIKKTEDGASAFARAKDRKDEKCAS
jgi:hypothetical protein